ncbi:SDR family NAD(P)-dependent oxidoreductase [Lentilactobacillus senioris]|uniref:SDR family NAD(P)-dependent oxidoreductase n=1 Tax=Lentilactobacillus senioris TaxID=931534 RepID=UPI003D298BFC
MKTTLITGGNKGIGLALAKVLGQQGWQVVVGVRNNVKGENAIAELASAGIQHADFVVIDLSKPETIDLTSRTMKQKYPDFSLLINNAGISGKMDFSLEEPESDLRQTMEVNFFGTFQLTQSLLPILRINGGRVINVTIPTAANPLWNPLAYKASKAAQNVMMESMAIDLNKIGQPVSIFSIHPGPTTTDLNGNVKMPGFHSTEKVATKMAAVINDGKSHNGEMIEIYRELKAPKMLEPLISWIQRKRNK